MLRGRYGKPYRPPPDGWISPRKIFFGGLYQHINSALNNLPAFVNTTQVQLQINQIGQPLTRPASGSQQQNCATLQNGLPEIPWIGVGANQGVPAVLGGRLNNTFTQQGTNSLGLNARLRGFKNVQACRQWHGCFGWISHDPGGLNNQICNIETCDANGNSPPTPSGLSQLNCGGGGSGTYTPTYTTRTFEASQPYPDQTKYLTVEYNENFSETYGDSQFTGSTRGGVTVSQNSGQLTSSLITYWEAVNTSTSPATVVSSISGGAGFANAPPVVNRPFGLPTPMDNSVAPDFHTNYPALPSTGVDMPAMIAAWNYQFAAYPLPIISDPNNYNATATDGAGNSFAITYSRTNTTVSWNWQWVSSDTNSTASFTYSGNRTLANPNLAADVYADVQSLLGYWNLADDAQYPPRTDGLWQVAPLVTREEQQQDTTPLGFIPCRIADLRAPIVDSNGNLPWTTPQNPPAAGWIYSSQNNDGAGNPPNSPDYGVPVAWEATYNGTTWFDPDAYGFTFPNGFDQSNSTANGLQQFALTGLVLGMPMPAAFTNPQSFWYQPGFSATANADFQNFFDFLAVVTKACQYNDGGGTFIDVYNWGYGEWLYDAISRTGAQLPHRATQWTPNNGAYNKPPYAYLIQGDKQTYDKDGSPGESDFYAWRADALWAQKCCEIQEIWPSQDFFRPAGNDRFAADENHVWCISNPNGATFALTTEPALNSGDIVGLNYGLYSGIFSVSSVSDTDVTLNSSSLRSLPTGFALPSGDTNSVLWKVRFPDAPAIEGRDAIAALTASGSNTILTLASPEVNLMTDDAIDICSTNLTYDAFGGITGETMTVIASNVTVTRMDDSHFQVAVPVASLAGAAYIVSHGAPNWYWDDNGRKGDFVALQWLYDYRTNAEVTRLASTLDCNEATANYYWQAAGSIPPQPSNAKGPPAGSPGTGNNNFQNTGGLTAICTGANSLNWDGSSFSAQGAIQYVPCCPSVIAITPNGETWKNAVVIPFPATFTFDDRYGARWQAEIEQAMADLLCQAPHRPCTLGSNDTWNIDDGTCHQPAANGSGGTDYYYAYYPLVEARINLPGNGGNGQNETAPALPSGMTIGYTSPVNSVGGLQPPGMIGWDTNSGNPVPGWTPWGYRLVIENSSCAPASCNFNYVDAENLACVTSYAPPAPASLSLTGLGGIT